MVRQTAYFSLTLVSNIYLQFASKTATQMISVMIECYQFSCYFAVPQKR